MQNLFEPLTNINQTLRSKLAVLNITSYLDLLLHIPTRYEDLTKIYPIATAKVGSQALVEGVIVSCEVIHKRMRQLQVKISDKTEVITLLFFHFYPNYATQFKVGKTIRAFGQIKTDFVGQKTILHPKIQTITTNSLPSTTLSPLYATTSGLTQGQLVKLIKNALLNCEIIETIPLAILKRDNLLSFKQAITVLHQLTPLELKEGLPEKALKRLKIDELLAQQLILYNAYQTKHANPSVPLTSKLTYTSQLVKRLPFSLTKAQSKVLNEIYLDLAKPKQMNRLLQGDVGSGKTIVATLAMLVAIENGYQACIMAPTEILAEQHYLKTKQLLEPLGINIVWLTGSLTNKEKQQAYAKIKTGIAQIIIGTHAVLQKQVEFNNLALIVIDEQHRFGVEQRLTIQQKGNNPHQLMMSATPIPRSLAMSYYADLDVSNIDELPVGRTPIKTLLINNQRKPEVIKFIQDACTKNQQAYWVCPLIEESEALELENALHIYQELNKVLQSITIGLIHGKLKAQEKAKIMQLFNQGKIQLLVATTVIEVGVDVPNASIMVIEHSERMGLSQLHQLRGRVGRGNIDSQCILLYQNPLSEIAKRRLKVIYANNDGFKIAQEDLLIRGPGELLGARQSGLPALKFANLESDLPVLKYAKSLAQEMMHKHTDLAKLHTKLWFNQEEHFLKA